MRWFDHPLLWLQGERVVDVLPSRALGEVWVTENPFCRYLRSSLFVIQTAMNKRRPWAPCSSHYRAVAEILRKMPEMKRFLMVGLGGGSFLHTVKHCWPDAVVEAIDIDPVMLAIAREYFDAPPEAILILMDARDYFRGDRGPFDFVFIDAFDGMCPPKELLTGQFFESVARALSPGGVVCMNTVRKHPWDSDYGKVRGLFKKAFAHTAEMFSLPGKAAPLFPHNIVLLGANGADAESITNRKEVCSSFKKLYCNRLYLTILLP